MYLPLARQEREKAEFLARLQERKRANVEARIAREKGQAIAAEKRAATLALLHQPKPDGGPQQHAIDARQRRWDRNELRRAHRDERRKVEEYQQYEKPGPELPLHTLRALQLQERVEFIRGQKVCLFTRRMSACLVDHSLIYRR